MSLARIAANALLLAVVTTSATDACRIQPGNRAYEPIMARVVAGGSGIYLATATGARFAPDRDEAFQHLRPIYQYRFEVDETLRGAQIDSFTEYGARPFVPELPEHCSSVDFDLSDGACETDVNNQILRGRAHQEADSKRKNWRSFYVLSRLGQAGMGTPQTYHADEILVGCGGDPTGFELGEQFLIIRHGSEEANNAFGLNFQLIKHPDDAWLQAVRYFIANPREQFLPARTLQDSVAGFGTPSIVEFGNCGDDEPYPYNPEFGSPRPSWNLALDAISHVEFYQRDEMAEDARSHCGNGGRFLLYVDGLELSFGRGHFAPIPPFPIRDGIVDFSHLATQWHIDEPRQVPLTEVLSWYTSPN